MTTTLRRTTIFLTGDQHDKLRRLAFEKRTSMARLIRDAAIEILEDEEDTIEGLKVLADNKETITWKEYQKARRERRSAV